ncbi:MAG: hypothetical protein AB7I38_02235 [Dehalococcoidia bacterium]
MTSTKVYLETGSKRVFACALDWPGWCRLGRTDDEALSRLAEYAPRYAVVVSAAGLDVSDLSAPTFGVVEHLDGSATTDFGAPGAFAFADREPASASEAGRLVALVLAAWDIFEDVAARAPECLAKGPRGGGRDRDRMQQHVLGAETAYGRKLDLRPLEPRLEDRASVDALHRAIERALRERLPAATVTGGGWPPRFAARRIAWHVLDHAWEIEDRGGLTPRMAP